MHRRTNVEDVGPTLYEWFTNVLCLLGRHMVGRDDHQPHAQDLGQSL